MGDDQSPEDVVAKIKKNATEEIRISRSFYMGHSLANMRVWFVTPDGSMRPSKKGLAFATRLLPEVIEGLTELHKRTR